jgi:hypothetical protein
MKLIISDSAFKHNFNSTDIENVFENPHKRYFDKDGNTIITGFSTKGVFIEIGYKFLNDNIFVFHCMKARKKFLK